MRNCGDVTTLGKRVSGNQRIYDRWPIKAAVALRVHRSALRRAVAVVRPQSEAVKLSWIWPESTEHTTCCGVWMKRCARLVSRVYPYGDAPRLMRLSGRTCDAPASRR